MAAFGVSTGNGDGWICRAIFTGGYYSDNGGYGISKAEAIEMFCDWDNDRPDLVSVQLFEYHERKPRTIKGTLVTEYDKYTDWYGQSEHL